MTARAHGPSLPLLASAVALWGCSKESDALPVLDVPYDTNLESLVRFDNAFVPEDYSDMASTPTGKSHVGVHYSPVLSHNADMPYYAMADGFIARVEPFTAVGKYMVNVQLDVGGGILLVYQFETESSDAGDLAAQQAKIAVGEGQIVRRGDLIGTLHDAGAPVPLFHLGVNQAHDLICLQPLLSADALARTQALIARDNPTWKICYEN